MKDPIEILISCKNQVFTPQRIRVTYNLSSHSCCMFYYRGLLHVKSTLKLVYILDVLLNERLY